MEQFNENIQPASAACMQWNCCFLVPIPLECRCFQAASRRQMRTGKVFMKITLNGTAKELAHPIGLDALVGQYCKNPRHVIAEVNGEILRSAQWQGKTVKDGDIIELVGFVGGG